MRCDLSWCRDRSPTVAVAYGRELVLGVTDGLLKLMGTRELTGVLAHEISHLRNGDTRIMMLSDVVGRFVQPCPTSGSGRWH